MNGGLNDEFERLGFQIFKGFAMEIKERKREKREKERSRFGEEERPIPYMKSENRSKG